MLSVIFICLSYLLGSISFGYLITKFSTGKNILEIGWRKTSASNVFKNVGLWQGFLTGIFDMGKGALAVYLAQHFGETIQVQALCGVAAVVGHNWSVFLKFAGGRGIATFVGALLILSPKLLGFSLIPFLLLAIIWNTSIGTIFFLTTAFILAGYFSQGEAIGTFILISSLFIFIKRLSPIKELSFQKKEIIQNRLLFDDDIPKFDLGIVRLLKKLTKK